MASERISNERCEVRFGNFDSKLIYVGRTVQCLIPDRSPLQTIFDSPVIAH
jgi:hypothetical protein